MCKSKPKSLKTSYNALQADERCIYQAVGDLEGGNPNTHCTVALQGGAKEVDDEAAMVVLAKHYGYEGPAFATGTDFNKKDFSGVSKILAICTGQKLKKAMVEASSADCAKLLMDPANTSGVTFHAIGITIEEGTRIIHDQQGLRSKGPFDKDDVLYWTKA